MTHEGQHQGCKPCFKIKLNSISFSSAATPNRRQGTVIQNKYQSDRVRDIEAYKRLRKEGLQPRGTLGAAAIEARADTISEVEMGRKMPDKQFARKWEAAKVELGERTAAAKKELA